MGGDRFRVTMDTSFPAVYRPAPPTLMHQRPISSSIDDEFNKRALTRQEILTMDKQGVERGEFSSEILTKILQCFGANFKLHQPNYAGLGIVGKDSSCSTI